jgi:hypothetical protein
MRGYKNVVCINLLLCPYYIRSNFELIIGYNNLLGLDILSLLLDIILGCVGMRLSCICMKNILRTSACLNLNPGTYG